MSRVVVAVVVVVAGACGRIGFGERGDGGDGTSSDAGPKLPDPATGVTSGTRLRAQYWDDGAGGRAFDHLFDTVMNTSCSPQMGPDGITRCLPAPAAYNSTLWADAGCTIPGIAEVAMFADQAACDAPLFVADATAGVFAIGTQIPKPYIGTPASCNQFDLGGITYAVGAQVPLDLFEPMTLATRVQAGTRLSYDVYEGDDGSALITSTFDEQLGADCVVEPDLGQSDPRCAPEPTAFNMFSDPGCTVPAIGSFFDIPAGTMFGVQAGRYGFTFPCGAFTYHVSGGSTATTLYYQEGACSTLPGYAVVDGGSLPRSMFQAGTYAYPGTGELAEKRWESDDGAYVHEPDVLWNRSTGLCYPRYDSSGVLRCIPGPQFAGSFFSDATCVTQAFVYTCGPEPAYGTSQNGGSSCGQPRVEGVMSSSGNALYGDIDGHGTCGPLDSDGIVHGWNSPAAPVADDQFPAISTIVE